MHLAVAKRIPVRGLGGTPSAVLEVAVASNPVSDNALLFWVGTDERQLVTEDGVPVRAADGGFEVIGTGERLVRVTD